jgi:hypothetical protein
MRSEAAPLDEELAAITGDARHIKTTRRSGVMLLTIPGILLAAARPLCAPAGAHFAFAR